MHHPADRLTVAIVDDVELTGPRLRQALERVSGVTVLGVFDQLAESGCNSLRNLRPDVAVVDPHQLGNNSAQLLYELSLCQPRLKIIVFTNDSSASGRVHYLANGAYAAFDKTLEVDKLLTLMAQLQ